MINKFLSGNWKRRHLTVYIILISFVSCSKLFGPDEIGPLPTHIDISMSARKDTTGEHLILFCVGGDYTYSNVIILTGITVEGKHIEIEFTGTECMEPCIEASYDNDRSAMGSVKFPFLEIGEYSIKMKRPNSSSTGTLHVSQFAFDIEIDPPAGLKFVNNTKTLGRIPENLLWGSFYDINQADQLNSLLEQMSEVGEFSPSNLPSNYYGSFSISDSGEFNSFEEYNADTSICVYYNGNTDALQSTFDTWFETYNGTYPSVHLYDGLGNVLWLP